MWAETLDRKAIFMRGWSENTSIDPSDTPDNMVKFLTSLNTALNASQPGHDETSLRLERDPKSDDDLTLHITCELAGLQPLKWPMYLKKLPACNTATNLVLPLIQAHHTKNLEIESLIRTLGHKDAVLTKLLDKLEAMGTGTEHVFNALSGKKKVSRATAADKVPGLAPFDQRRWKSDLAYKEDTPNDTESLVQTVFASEGLQFEPMTESTGSPQLDQWWQDFEGASSTARQPQQKAALPKDKSPPPKDTETSHVEDDDDDFQVQSTPPHLLSKGRSTDAKDKPAADDASTEGDDESMASTKGISPAPQTHKTDKPVRRLGALGRKKQSTPPVSPDHVQPQPKTKPLTQKDDSETASEAEDDGVTISLPAGDPSSSSSSSSQPGPAAKKSGLGRIGGARAKQPGKTDLPPIDLEAAESSTAAVPHHPSKKLGVIGKHNGDKDEARLLADEGSRRGRSTANEVTAESKPRETSQERADRRREELKRELEKKAAAGPAKKKRRF
ncbi:hypothetical protein FSARC_8268 [Fusarium sarcochroum]|uniref:Non-homologous end-joining factor 1 n=1 Tax=Fusarium sarcochroum TaxID=1208366 RepID=A0A8H4TTM9_9HYPO|nr:hypothetical protein FSARC_8268 [Fusarium sarcochroum]